MKVELEAVDGPVKGRKFVFKEHGTFLVGRAAEAHLQFSYEDDPYISRRHFLMEINPPECRIQDLDSTNGTEVNGREIAKLKWHELKEGDLIKIGYTTLKLGVKELICCIRCGKEVQGKPGQKILCAECQEKEKKAEEEARRKRAVKCAKCGRVIPSDEVEEGKTPVCYKCTNEEAEALLHKIIEGIGLRAQEPKAVEGAPSVPGYEVLKLLGRGGMGAVWLAKEKGGELVAIKTVLPERASDERGIKHFQRETEVITSLEHPHIVRLIDYGLSNGRFYFIMEYVEGIDAQTLLAQRGGKMSVEEAIPIILQVLDALEYVHKRGIVHRDIKPPQILLAESGGGWVAKLSDFGLAKNFQEAGMSGMTLKGEFGGSIPFMPPEQITNYRFVNPPSDIFGIGATLYHLLTGQFVFNFKRPKEPWLDILEGKPIPIKERNSETPQPIAKVIDKAVRRDAADRYQDGHEMKVALEGAWQYLR